MKFWILLCSCIIAQNLLILSAFSASETTTKECSFYIIPHSSEKEPYEIEAKKLALTAKLLSPFETVIIEGFNGKTVRKFSIQGQGQKINLPPTEILSIETVDKKYKKVVFQANLQNIPSDSIDLDEIKISQDIKIPSSKANARNFEKFRISAQSDALKKYLLQQIQKKYTKNYPANIRYKIYWPRFPIEIIQNGNYHFQLHFKITALSD